MRQIFGAEGLGSWPSALTAGNLMTGRIVVGIDGSPQSGRRSTAAARACPGGEELELLHAYSFTPPVAFFGYHASQPASRSLTGSRRSCSPRPRRTSVSWLRS